MNEMSNDGVNEWDEHALRLAFEADANGHRMRPLMGLGRRLFVPER